MVARMLAAQRDRYGSPDVVELREIDVPVPKDGEVLVRVHAASVNRADLDWIEPRPGFMRAFLGLRAPRNPSIGTDVAGVVDAVGPGVTAFKAGDRVFGDLFVGGQGSFAEYVCRKERSFQPMPSGMSFEDAATLPHSAVLALQGLRHPSGRSVGAGDRLLVDGASGNVGPFAVQIAKAIGAEVTATCSPGKVEFVRSLGADHVLDYTAVDYTRTGERYDWIMDTDSHHPILRARRALAPDGVYVTLGGPGPALLTAGIGGALLSRLTRRKSGLMLWWKPMHRPDVERLERLIADGRVQPRIDRRFPLEQVVDALRWVDEGHARGKVVVTMGDA
jgi:NADPH:quinone reductase-like Zn-dependent oxidoreductase